MNANSLPMVSVLMTAFNRQDYIAEAIESVLASDFKDIELIIVDDCSADDTVKIAREYEKQDRRVRVFVNEKNLGDYPNRNKAASCARGKYLKYVDSDDLIYPWGLGIMVQCMERFPEAGYGLSAYARNDQCHPILVSSADAYRQQYFSRNELFGRSPGSSIIRREAFEDVGGFTGMRQLGDMEFWLIIGAVYPLVTLPRDLVWDRSHAAQEQFQHSSVEKARMRSGVVRAALERSACPLSKSERRRAVASENYSSAKAFWRLALRHGRIAEALAYKRAVMLPAAALSLPFVTKKHVRSND